MFSLYAFGHLYSNCGIFVTYFHSFYEELESHGLLQPLTCRVEGDREHSVGTKHFIATKGAAALVEYYLEKSGTSVSDIV